MMDFNYFGVAPVQLLLPSLFVADVMRTLAWTLTLGFALAHLTRRFRSGPTARVAWVLASGVLLLLVAPIKLSLSLAFQTPSLMTQLMLLLWMIYGEQPNPISACAEDRNRQSWVYLGGVLLGWLLLLDTLAVFPLQGLAMSNFSLYQWGFTWPAQVSVLVVLAGLCFVAPALSGLGLLAVAIFIATHAPTGNLWDALLDPMLWVYCHVKWLGAMRVRR